MIFFIQIISVQSLQEKIRDLSDIECAEGSDPDSLAGSKVKGEVMGRSGKGEGLLPRSSISFFAGVSSFIERKL